MKANKETYLQKVWSNSIDDITIEHVKKAITEIQKVSEDQGMFWVGIVNEDESILEVHKDMSLIAVFEDEPETQNIYEASSWKEVEQLYSLFLEGKFAEVKAIFNK